MTEKRDYSKLLSDYGVDPMEGNGLVSVLEKWETFLKTGLREHAHIYLNWGEKKFFMFFESVLVAIAPDKDNERNFESTFYPTKNITLCRLRQQGKLNPDHKLELEVMVGSEPFVLSFEGNTLKYAERILAMMVANMRRDRPS